MCAANTFKLSHLRFRSRTPGHTILSVFECAHLKFMVSGRSKQTNQQARIRTCMRNAFTLGEHQHQLTHHSLCEYLHTHKV